MWPVPNIAVRTEEYSNGIVHSAFHPRPIFSFRMNKQISEGNVAECSFCFHSVSEILSMYGAGKAQESKEPEWLIPSVSPTGNIYGFTFGALEDIHFQGEKIKSLATHASLASLLVSLDTFLVTFFDRISDSFIFLPDPSINMHAYYSVTEKPPVIVSELNEVIFASIDARSVTEVKLGENVFNVDVTDDFEVLYQNLLFKILRTDRTFSYLNFLLYKHLGFFVLVTLASNYNLPCFIKSPTGFSLNGKDPLETQILPSGRVTDISKETGLNSFFFRIYLELPFDDIYQAKKEQLRRLTGSTIINSRTALQSEIDTEILTRIVLFEIKPFSFDPASQIYSPTLILYLRHMFERFAGFKDLLKRFVFRDKVGNGLGHFLVNKYHYKETKFVVKFFPARLAEFQAYGEEEFENELAAAKRIFSVRLRLPNFTAFYAVGLVDVPMTIITTDKETRYFCDGFVPLSEVNYKGIPGKITHQTVKKAFIISEYVSGMISLRNYIAETPPLPDVLDILIQIVFALYYAQETVQFFHNDLHTANIILFPVKEFFTKKVYVKYVFRDGLSFVVQPTHIPVIIDYGRAKFPGSSALTTYDYLAERSGQANPPSALDFFTMMVAVDMSVDFDLLDLEGFFKTFYKMCGIDYGTRKEFLKTHCYKEQEDLFYYIIPHSDPWWETVPPLKTFLTKLLEAKPPFPDFPREEGEKLQFGDVDPIGLLS